MSYDLLAYKLHDALEKTNESIREVIATEENVSPADYLSRTIKAWLRESGRDSAPNS